MESTALAELRALVPNSGPPDARIPPGRRADVGVVNWTIAAVAGKVAGAGRPMHIFTTLGRRRGLFRWWLLFSRKLMPAGTLPRADTELAILRVAANASSHYEWHQHVLIGLRAGLSAERIAALVDGPDAGGWTPRQEAILRAADELHDTHHLRDETFAALREHLSEDDVIELLLLIGNYEGLAMALNGLGVQVERPVA